MPRSFIIGLIGIVVFLIGHALSRYARFLYKEHDLSARDFRLAQGCSLVCIVAGYLDVVASTMFIWFAEGSIPSTVLEVGFVAILLVVNGIGTVSDVRKIVGELNQA